MACSSNSNANDGGSLSIFEMNKDSFNIFMSESDFEKNGIYNVCELNVAIALSDKFVYLLAKKERVILKTDKSGKVLNRFQANEGQGPGELIDPKDFAIYKNNVAIHDITKRRILLFDSNLNYIDEITPPDGVERIIPDLHGGWVAWQEGEGNVFARYNDKWEKVSSFGEFKETVALSNIMPAALKRGYLSSSAAIVSSWAFYNPKCRAVVYFIDENKSHLELTWDNKWKINQNDVNERRKITECRGFFAYDHKIVGFFALHERMGRNPEKEIIVFDRAGKIILRRVVDYDLLPVYYSGNSCPIFVALDNNILINSND